MPTCPQHTLCPVGMGDVNVGCGGLTDDLRVLWRLRQRLVAVLVRLEAVRVFRSQNRLDVTDAENVVGLRRA